jgi:CubicO group peptidase (beta-lactamase class C family)
VDFSQWVLMNMNGGVWGGKRVLQPASQAFMWEPLAKIPEEWNFGSGFNSGWFMGKEGDSLWKATIGDGPGTQSVVFVRPREGLAVIMFSNVNGSLSQGGAYTNGFGLLEFAQVFALQMLHGDL